MSESTGSFEFIIESKKKYGPMIWIQKVKDEIHKGTPDIEAVFYGIPVFLESKLVHELSLCTTHKFTPMQIHKLKERAKAGAVCGGLLICNKKYRFIDYQKIPENGLITKELYETLEVFSWPNVTSRWRQMANF